MVPNVRNRIGTQVSGSAMRQIIPCFIGFFLTAFHENGCAIDLPTTCAPISLITAPTSFGQPTTVQVTNQCGQCASISFNIFNNGSPQGFASTHQSMAPGEARRIVFTATKLGTTEARVVRVESCPTPASPQRPTTRNESASPHAHITVKPSQPVGRLMVCDDDGSNCRTPATIKPSSHPRPGTATIRPIDPSERNSEVPTLPGPMDGDSF